MISAHFDCPGEIVVSQDPCSWVGGSDVLFSSCMTRMFRVFGVSEEVQQPSGGEGPEVVTATASTFRTRTLASEFNARLRDDSELSRGGSYDSRFCRLASWPTKATTNERSIEVRRYSRNTSKALVSAGSGAIPKCYVESVTRSQNTRSIFEYLNVPARLIPQCRKISIRNQVFRIHPTCKEQ
jgi:hypothetical protein